MSSIPINQIITGDALEVLKTLPENSIDAICCDPPAGINFMGTDFDKDRGGRAQWVAWLADIMSEALRVLKPGGHAFVWALPRTSHWTACALEDAGFEIREKCYHIFASGFPKSYNIAKGIEGVLTQGSANWTDWKHLPGERVEGENVAYGMTRTNAETGNRPRTYVSTGTFELEPTTEEAKKYEGWGTALKPAVEEWILCRKPLDETSVARNVLEWGTGGINIDACRIGNEPRENRGMSSLGVMHDDNWQPQTINTLTTGRWPAHLLISHAEDCHPGECVPSCPALELDKQSGNRKSGGGIKSKSGHSIGFLRGEEAYHFRHDGLPCEPSEGGASRFFTQFYYAPKASKAERNLGCEHLPAKQTFDKNTSQQIAHISYETGDVTYSDYVPSSNQNHHPTVKNQSLMRWLCKLITPPGGIVLDCFAGSGSTGIAALAEGFHFVGIEVNPEYAAIATARLNHALLEQETEAKREKQLTMFDVPPVAKKSKATIATPELWQLDTVAS